MIVHSIPRIVCLKLQKVDKGDGTLHKSPKLSRQYFRILPNIYGKLRYRTEKLFSQS